MVIMKPCTTQHPTLKIILKSKLSEYIPGSFHFPFCFSLSNPPTMAEGAIKKMVATSVQWSP